MTIIEAIDDPQVFGKWLHGFDMTAWRPFHAAVHGLPMTDDQANIYQKCTGRVATPTAPLSEIFAGIGRRGGKSFNVALESVFAAAIDTSWQRYLAPGQVAVYGVFSVDRRGCREIKNYCSGILRSSPLLRKLIVQETQDEIVLSTGCTIEIRTASFRLSRGPAYVGVGMDEIGFLRDAEISANPASEILSSVRPAILPGGKIFGISSVFNQQGILYDMFKRYYDVADSEGLFWKADTVTMNPKFSQKKIDREMADDRQRAAAEYYSQWRTDLATLFDAATLELCIIPGRDILPYERGFHYVAFTDPSGGRRDSAALSIAHEWEGKLIIDLAREWRSPHNPQQVCSEIAEIVKAYGIGELWGDRYGGSWPENEYRKYGVAYRLAEKTASELYIAVLPMFSSGVVELLDSQRLRNELLSLMRRTGSAGKDSVIVGAGSDSHADLANAVCGALVSIKAQPWGPLAFMTDHSLFEKPHLSGYVRRIL